MKKFKLGIIALAAATFASAWVAHSDESSALIDLQWPVTGDSYYADSDHPPISVQHEPFEFYQYSVNLVHAKKAGRKYQIGVTAYRKEDLDKMVALFHDSSLRIYLDRSYMRNTEAEFQMLPFTSFWVETAHGRHVAASTLILQREKTASLRTEAKRLERSIEATRIFLSEHPDENPKRVRALRYQLEIMSHDLEQAQSDLDKALKYWND